MLDAAIYGLGNWGRRLVGSVQGQSDKIRFVRGVSRHPEKVRDFADKEGFTIVTSYQEALADPAVQAVILATPHSLHHEHVIGAAKAGKHVFVEKPFALNGPNARAAAQACADAGVVMAVAHSRRFRPAIIELKRLVDDGALGDIVHVEGNYSGPAGYRHEGHWRSSREENPAGGMAARGIHVLDALIHILGPVARVQSVSERKVLDQATMDDTTAALLRFRNGITGYLCTMMATSQFWRIHIFGSKASAEMFGEDTLLIRQLDGTATTKPFPTANAQRAELECFADAVAGRTTYPVSPEEAVHGVEVMEAMARSAERGGAAVTIE